MTSRLAAQVGEVNEAQLAKLKNWGQSMPFLTDREAPAETIHHRQQGAAVRLIPRPQLAAHRLPRTGQDCAHDHLAAIRPVILGVAELQNGTSKPLTRDSGIP